MPKNNCDGKCIQGSVASVGTARNTCYRTTTKLKPRTRDEVLKENKGIGQACKASAQSCRGTREGVCMVGSKANE